MKIHDFPEALTTAEAWLLHVAILGYLIAAVLALVGLFWPRRFSLTSTHIVAGISSLVFTTYFFLRFTHTGLTPLANLFEVLLLVAFGMVIAYFLVVLRRRVQTLAAWVFPMVAVTLFLALPLGVERGPTSVNDSRLGIYSNPMLVVHIILAVIATTQFAFASVVSIVYLLQDRTLRRKRDSLVLQTLPPLEALERMVYSATAAGLIFMTISLIFAFSVIRDNIGQHLLSPTVISSLTMWGVFFCVVFGRYTKILRGRREMYLVLAGFAIIVMVYIGFSLMPEGAHLLSANASR